MSSRFRQRLHIQRAPAVCHPHHLPPVCTTVCLLDWPDNILWILDWSAQINGSPLVWQTRTKTPKISQILYQAQSLQIFFPNGTQAAAQVDLQFSVNNNNCAFVLGSSTSGNPPLGFDWFITSGFGAGIYLAGAPFQFAATDTNPVPFTGSVQYHAAAFP